MEVLIRADGRVESLPERTEPWELEELQKLVGGQIAVIEGGGGKVLVVNEEGLWLGLPINRVVSEGTGRPLVGDAVLTDRRWL